MDQYRIISGRPTRVDSIIVRRWIVEECTVDYSLNVDDILYSDGHVLDWLNALDHEWQW